VRKGLGWPLINLAAYLATVFVNWLANALPLNGVSSGDVVNRDPVYFQPANWAFGIWGLIYVLLGAFVVYGLLPWGRRNDRLQRISPLFTLTCAANIVWLFLWHWELLPLSMVAMVVLLLALLGIYQLLRSGGREPSRAERLLLRLPFSVYLGWISVATIANAAVTLDRAGWDGWGLSPVTWAIIMVGVGALLAAAVGIGRADAAYAAVFAWAYFALALRQSGAPSLAAAAAAGAAFSLFVAYVALRRRDRGHAPYAARTG
jgi:hypothetical protein